MLNINDLPPGSYTVAQPQAGATPPLNINDLPPGSYKVLPPPSLLEQVGSNLKNTFKQGGQNVVKDISDIGQNAENAGGSPLADVAAVGTAAGHIAGDIAGTAGGIIGSFISPVLPKVVTDTIGNVSQYINDKLNQIPGMTPDIHKGLGDLFNTLSLEGGAKAEPAATEAISNAAGDATNAVNGTVKNLTDKLPKLNPTAEDIVAQRTSTLNDLANKYVSVGNAVDAAKARGFDPIADISSDDRFIPEINTDGKIDASKAIQNLNNYIKPTAQAERAAIVADGTRVSFDKFANDVKDEIAPLTDRGSSFKTIENKIDADLDVYKRYVDENGTISLTKLDDIKNAKYSISNFNNEDAQIADKAVARVARQTIIDNVKNSDIQGLNRTMSQYYSARDVLDSIDGKIVKGGRLGKYFARIIGGAIGSHFGPLGIPAGAVAGDAIESGILKSKMNPIFGNDVKLKIPQPNITEDTIQNLNKPKLQLPGKVK